MSLQYIIDGYNIIHHPQFLSSISRKNKDLKLSLLSLIRSKKLTQSPRNSVIVVFDGYPKSIETKQAGGIEIIFSCKNSADEKIKRIIEESKNPKNIVVVSDDKELKFLVKALGAKAINVEEFIGSSKDKKKKREELLEYELNYSERHKINEELRKLWLE